MKGKTSSAVRLALAIAACALLFCCKPASKSLVQADFSRSLEALQPFAQVSDSLPIPVSRELHFPNLSGRRATGPVDDPDYAVYGEFRTEVDLDSLDLAGYNRIRFAVRPECPGLNVTNLNLVIGGVNHLVNLENHRKNVCYLELDPLETGPISRMEFVATQKGKDNAMAADSSHYYISDIAFERIEHPQITRGWQPRRGSIILSGSGYDIASAKTAIISGADAMETEEFCVMENGSVVMRAPVQAVSTGIGRYGLLDFSTLDREGTYTIKAGAMESHPFAVSADIWKGAQQKLLNFVFAQRCGHDVPGIHDRCHTDLFAHHNGQSICYAGGWHDAGDLSQQTLQTADVAFALLEASLGRSDKLGRELMQEALWGYSFVLDTRFGDGFRASSMGLKHWTDGIVGTYDDIHTVRVQNNAFDNFLYSAYEAWAAPRIRDRRISARLAEAAQEDYAFAVEKMKEGGITDFPHIMEHSYNTSLSQFHATASWAACQLYSLTGREEYARDAAMHMDYVLECQHSAGMPGGHQGFFYRDIGKEVPVHFIHQSRDQIYAMALDAICRTFPDDPRRPQWESAYRLYGNYLKSLMQYTAPYGMMPSGVYRQGEYSSAREFERLHIFAPDDAAMRFDAQLQHGVDLGGGYYIKRFPVWFNIYNGNSAIHLSTGKAAAVCGRYFADEELLQIGREQLYWTVGKNPFGQSLIYGEGWNYPQMDSFSSGEICGETPVGIRSWQDEDIPYWPAHNNACYKEVWVTSAGKLLSLIAEIQK